MKQIVEKAIKLEHTITSLKEITFAMQQLEEAMVRMTDSIVACNPECDVQSVYDSVVDIQMLRTSVLDVMEEESGKLELILEKL